MAQKNAPKIKTVTVIAPPAKAWYKSKIIWFNAIAAILLVVSGMLPMVSTVIPTDVYAIVVGVVNIALRFFTQSELK